MPVIYNQRAASICVKACPHCRRKVRLSHKSETVAVVSPFFLPQSHFSATVWTGLYWSWLCHDVKPCPHCRTKVRLSQKTANVAELGDSLTFLRQCERGFTLRVSSHFPTVFIHVNVIWKVFYVIFIPNSVVNSPCMYDLAMTPACKLTCSL